MLHEDDIDTDVDLRITRVHGVLCVLERTGHGAEEGDTGDDYVPPMDETFYDARCRCALRSTIADVSHRHADAGDEAHAEKCSAVDGRCDDGDVVESLLQSIESKRLETLRLVLEKRNADETRVKKEEERMRELNLTKRENSIAADATRPPSGSLTSKPDTRELRKSSRMFRYISVGAAAVAGGIAVGLTGGLAAPAIAASIGSLQAVLGAGVLSTSAASLGTMLSSGAGVATVYGAFGVAGASVVGGKVSYLLGDVEDFVIAKIVNESEEDEDGADEEAESKDDAETTTSSEGLAGQGGARSAALSGHASEVAGERETDANTNNIVEQMREPTKDNEDAAPATPPQPSAAAVLCISGWLEADGSATAAVKAPEGGKEGNAPGEEAGENTQTDPSSDYFVAEEGLGLAPEGGEMDDGSEGTAPQDTTASSSPGPSPAPLTQLASSAAAAAASAATAVVVATTGSSKKVNRRVGYMRPWVSVRVQGWDRLCLEWEEKELAAMSNGMSAYLSQSAVKNALAGGAMHTALAGVVSALAFPVTLIAAADVIDNAWSVINHRVEKVADVLAHLITKRTGWSRRPLSLIGFGLGAKIIFKACENLHARGMRGAIEHCILIGAPVTSSASAWSKLRAVSAGRLVNVYSESDWIIKLLHRDGVIASGAAGLKPVGVDETHLEVENVDAAAKLGIYAQSDYAGRMEDILTELGVGSPC